MPHEKSAREALMDYCGYSNDSHWDELMSRFRMEAIRDAAAWLHSVGESSAAYLLLTCDVPASEAP